MNFLAHLYLSGNSDEIKLGNFIGDWVKGRGFEKYPAVVQQGILLHRKIDIFMDLHPVSKKSAQRLHDKYGRYSGIVIDILYDHFLAKHWDEFSNQRLRKYVLHCYKLFIRNYALLPSQVKKILPFLVASNRLESYFKIDGIRSALHIMSDRTSLPDETDFAINTLKEYYEDFNKEFFDFFPEIIEYVKKDGGIIFD